MNQLLDKEEVAKFLGVSVKTVERLKAKRAIPFVKLPFGRSIRFDSEQIQRWVKCNTTIEKTR